MIFKNGGQLNEVLQFLNIKIDLAEAIAKDKFQKNIQMSPWFMSRGTMTKRDNSPYWIPPEPIELIIGSQSDDVIGRPIFFCFVDEISFLKNKDVEEQKKKAKEMINTAKGGMKTRFIFNGKNPTLLCVASSKRSEQSFMETYIRELGEDDNVFIVDKPAPTFIKKDGVKAQDINKTIKLNLALPTKSTNFLIKPFFLKCFKKNF